jgi:hypothetical protein
MHCSDGYGYGCNSQGGHLVEAGLKLAMAMTLLAGVTDSSALLGEVDVAM